MSRRELCPACSSRGICWFCNGTGWRKIAINGETVTEICSACDGRGTCAECDGQGYVIVSEDAVASTEDRRDGGPTCAPGGRSVTYL